MEFKEKIRQWPATQKLLAHLGEKPLRLKNLHPWGLSILLEEIAKKAERPILLLTPSLKEGNKLFWLLKERIAPLAIYSTLMIPELSKEILPQILTSQMTAQSILQNKGGLVVASIVDFLLPGFAATAGPHLRTGMELSPQTLLDTLIELGYQRVDNAVSPLDVAWRGDTLEFFEPHRRLPLRLEFLGNKLERLGFFDPISKSWQESRREISLLFWQKGKTLTSFLEKLPHKPWLFFLSPEQSYEVAKGVLLTEEAIQRELATANKLFTSLNPVEIGSLSTSGALDFGFRPPTLFAENWPKLVEFLKKHQGFEIFISSHHNPKLLEKFILEANSEPSAVPNLEIISPPLEGGFLHPSLKTILLTDQELFRQEVKTAKTAPSRAQKILLAELKIGDYAVHSEHGIGILKAFSKLTIENITRDYLVIEYAQGDTLYVPIEQIDKVTKLIQEGGEVKLHRLAGEAWKRSIARIKKETLEFAKELLKLYAKRSLSASAAYSKDDFWEEAIASTFSYEETPDQEKAIQEIYADLESDQPMDRLLVADVGFGKTEVAIRATLKAVTSGYQVALLAPTTILVEQHFKTFKNRLEPFGSKIASLSRFQSAAEQKNVLEKLKNHQVEVVVGTHRLLSKDVNFAKLGLLIIDEEQRFGVKQKERLKEIRAQVDVLSMTATPIPRTLNLALSGIRDITVIETPPLGRIPIETFVEVLDWEKVEKAIREEIRRGGQVYFVHNKVRTIPTIKHRLQTLLPEVKFVVAHGQMPEKELAKIMEGFYAGRFDVLVASTIIENGLDNPRVNTLIIDDASRFGLSQLHQLRGRIGRSNIQAKAYFFYRKGNLTPKMIARLKTIAEETTLGSGMNIALKDLKLRGSGGILSARQHGHIQAVGLPMYLKLLQAAILEIQTGTKRTVDTVTIDLPISAYLPVSYILQEGARIRVYQKLSLLTEEREFLTYLTELESDFGRLPKEVKNLALIIKLKIRALSTQAVKSIRAVKAVGEGRKGKAPYIVTFELIGRAKVAAQELPEGSRIEGDKLRLPVDFGQLEKAFALLFAALRTIKR